MLPHLLALLGGRSEPNSPLPTLGAVTVSSAGAGACEPLNTEPLTPAAIHVEWSIANADPTEYDTRVLRNGVVVAGLANTATSYTANVEPRAIENSNLDPWWSDWTFTIEVVWKQDGRVVASASSAPWLQRYGRCPAFPGEDET